MGIVETFENFAAAFESAVDDGDWSKLGKYLADDATYVNIGGQDPKCEGRVAIIEFLKADVASTDNRFDTRTLVAVTSPRTNGNRLSRRWRCTYTLAKAPDLVVEGEARYLFANGLIKEIEEHLSPVSLRAVNDWMKQHGGKLHA